MQHVVALGNLQIGVADQRVVNRVALGFFNVRTPGMVILNRIHAEPDDLAVALVEFRLQFRGVAKLGSADRREVLRMGEQYGPAIPDPFMKVDRTGRGFGREIRGLIANV